MDVHADSPLEQLISKYFDETRGDEVRLRSLVEETFHLQVPAEVVHNAHDPAAMAGALKDQVDHPGRLERMAERLLHDGQC